MAGKCIAKYVRVSPKKVKRILALIRGKSVDEAYRVLRFTGSSASVPIEKALKSAVANVSIKPTKPLKVIKAWVGGGPALKRMRPMAMGRGALYKRRTSHITVVVE